MATEMDKYALWRRTLARQNDVFDSQRAILCDAFLSFRDRVSALISTIGAELPWLTIHDISHIDALWRVADEIAGPDYILNPAEAFVLGGAFLLHDAAHVIAAYPGRLAEIMSTDQWQDLIAQRYEGQDPPNGSAEEKIALFQILRNLHAEQARKLPFVQWYAPGSNDPIYLLEKLELRQYYGDLIGEIAASHHWATHRVVDLFRDRNIPLPGFLHPAAWSVDVLKVAFLLRTADAAHIDSQRAPWFLFALRQPEGISADHWRFQANLGQPMRTSQGELRIASGNPFMPKDRRAWWLAYEAACLVDRELRDAYMFMRDEKRECFAANCVLGAETPESFSRQVRVRDWEPVNVAPTITNVPRLIAVMGGAKLYGDHPSAALRELLQNAMDAVRALRALRVIGDNEGEVHVSIEQVGDDNWRLNVTDNGIGMSRYVLTNVLLDFGHSLWSSDTLREEMPGLAKTGFKAAGQFGIGFYSVFMLGSNIHVATRRFERSINDNTDQWLLQFEEGLQGRPLLTRANGADRLQRNGTRVSVELTTERLIKLLTDEIYIGPLERVFQGIEVESFLIKKSNIDSILQTGGDRLMTLLGRLCPASEVTLCSSFLREPKRAAVLPNDWITIDDNTLVGRVGCDNASLHKLVDEDGTLLGRFGLGRNYTPYKPAALTVGGVHCGNLIGLVGLGLVNGNNRDIRRTDAAPAGSTASWSDWAERLINEEKKSKLSREDLLRLHPLIRNRDLPVWRINNEQLTFVELIERLTMSNKVVVIFGDISYEESDDIGKDAFYSSTFEFYSDLVLVPKFSSSRTRFIDEQDEFPWSLGVKPISYIALLKEKLKLLWENFEELEEEDAVVGEIAGVEIIRPMIVYQRSQ
ncbi:MAG: ATP-binding protein [Pseudomonadota bacterium]